MRLAVLFVALVLPDAHQLAKSFEKHYRSIRTLRAVFLQSYQAGPGELQVESGVAYFRRPGQMRWEYEAPEKKIFVLDGRTAWLYTPGERVVRRAPIRNMQDWRMPLALLAGHADLKHLCGVLTRVPSQGGPGTEASYAELLCMPNADTAAQFRDALIVLDRDGRLVRVVVHQAGDVTTEIRFAAWQENLPLPASLFRFTPPPGVSVVSWQAVP
jgi:outer membrane lipoprotein carrier protein